MKLTFVYKGSESSGFHGHAGIPGHQGGSQADTGGKLDWQGRPLKPDRVLMGGNLTSEEVAIIDAAASNPRSTFRGKDVNKQALDSMLSSDLVMPVEKLARSYDQYYKLTTKGQEVRNQLVLVRNRLTRELRD